MRPPRQEVERRLRERWPGTRLVPLTGDASARRFYRAILPDGPSRVVMDYGGPFKGETDDVRLARLFGAAGLPVARVLETDAETGFLLLEDLGDRLLERALAEARDRGHPHRGRELVCRAARLAGEVARLGTPVLAASERAAGPTLDAERFRFEMDYYFEHFVGGLRRVTSPPPGLAECLRALADRAAATPRRVFCHRDFHSRNLMVLEDGHLAMVDLQDARWGPDAYDLASLLHDGYIDVDPAWIEGALGAFREGLGEEPTPGFDDRLAVVAAQRMLKALGTYGYQTHRLGRGRYREAIPRTLGRLRALLPARDETRELGRLLLGAGLLEDAA